MEGLEKGRQLSPEMPGWAMLLGQAVASTGDVARAAATVDELAPDPTAHPLITLAHVFKHALLGEADAADALTTEDFVKLISGDGQYSHQMAQAQALLGRVDEGLRWLEEATETCFLNHPFLAERDPLLENLRGDPRFATLMSGLRRKWETFEADVGVA